MYLILLYCMIFCHIIDDYVLQNVLGKLKQKKFWQEEVHKEISEWRDLKNTIYKNDFIVALICHAFEWSFMINLPLLLLVYNKVGITIPFLIFFNVSIIVNTITHSVIDNIKANEKAINLVTDQLLHFAQIIITWVAFGLINGFKWV